MKDRTVSVIVPAYNEEKTIGNVVQTLLKSPLLNEVICINDGSKDNTSNILENFKDQIIYIDLKENKGKGYAMAEGIKRANGELIMFLDADFTNLSEIHIETLLEPIFKDNYRIVMGYLLNPYNENAKNFALDITGQRVYYKEDLLPHLNEMSNVRFGIEVLLNDIFKDIPTKKIPLKNLRGLYKYEKFNSTEALKEYIKEAMEIIKVIANKNSLMKEDYKILKNVVDSNSIRDLKTKVEDIKNKKLKFFIENYILKYISLDHDKKSSKL